jgi:hypothetical protein
LARLTEAGAVDAGHGRRVRPGDIQVTANGVCAWLDPAGALVAVGKVDASGAGKVLRGFGRLTP